MFSERPLHAARLGACLTLAAILLTAIGCGHKSPPIPPPLKHPAKTTDLTVQQRGNQLIVRFTTPQTTVSGLPVEALTTVQYWELVRPVPSWTTPTEPTAELKEDEADPSDPGAAESGPPDLFTGLPGSGDDPARPDSQSTSPAEQDEEDGAASAGDGDDADESAISRPEPSEEELMRVELMEFTATAVLKLELEEPELTAAVVGDRIVMSFDFAPPAPADTGEAADDAPEERQYGSVFAVKTAVSPRLVSGFSNLATIAYRDPPPPPETFFLEPRPGGVLISWQAKSDDLEGYHVYRRDVQSKSYSRPLAFVPVSEPEDPAAPDGPEDGSDDREYFDQSAAYGQRYIYSLTAVSKRTPVVESAFALEREVDYADRFPPTPPRNPVALAEADRVRFLWDASPQDDVAGYVVFRSEEAGEFVPLFDEPIVGLEYSDRSVRTGRTYEYRVVAVDFEGNESRPSQSASARVP